LRTDSATLLRFEGFELDVRTRELRRDGRSVKLQDLPVKLLMLLASRPGELVTREEIERGLWGEDQFVDFEHGINTAMRKIREALGEEPEHPRFIETLPRKGYRFIAHVEALGPEAVGVAGARFPSYDNAAAQPNRSVSERSEGPLTGTAASTHQAAPDSFSLPRGLARSLFLLIQVGYLAMYCAALYRAEAVYEVLEAVYAVPAGGFGVVTVVTAMAGIAVRLYLLTSVGLDHPAAGTNYRRIFPALFLLDTLWALSPLLLARKLGVGLGLAAVAALAYLPFAQRTLIANCYRSASK
jgi:DNA-binding winged helix-turn-helix (wHTH) protein